MVPNRITFEALEARVAALESALKKSEDSKKTGLTPALKTRLEAGERMLKAFEGQWSKVEERLEDLEVAMEPEP